MGTARASGMDRCEPGPADGACRGPGPRCVAHLESYGRGALIQSSSSWLLGPARMERGGGLGERSAQRGDVASGFAEREEGIRRKEQRVQR
jgi:hypothetical protein